MLFNTRINAIAKAIIVKVSEDHNASFSDVLRSMIQRGTLAPDAKELHRDLTEIVGFKLRPIDEKRLDKLAIANGTNRCSIIRRLIQHEAVNKTPAQSIDNAPRNKCLLLWCPARKAWKFGRWNMTVEAWLYDDSNVKFSRANQPTAFLLPPPAPNVEKFNAS